MSTTENSAEMAYKPGDIIALTIPQEPILGTRLQDENGYICENVGPKEHCNERACWVWEDKTGNILPPRMTWTEILSDATSPLTVLPPVFTVGDIITLPEQLDLLPNDTVVLDSTKDACQKTSPERWYVNGVFVPTISDTVELPATILWLPEDEEHA